MGLAWDVFGTGKTSVKINAGKYLQAAQTGLTYSALQPVRTAEHDGDPDMDRCQQQFPT